MPFIELHTAPVSGRVYISMDVIASVIEQETNPLTIINENYGSDNYYTVRESYDQVSPSSSRPPRKIRTCHASRKIATTDADTHQL